MQLHSILLTLPNAVFRRAEYGYVRSRRRLQLSGRDKVFRFRRQQPLQL